MNRSLALALLVALGGCYSAPSEFQEHACQRNTDCDDGYTCQLGFCHHSTAATGSGSVNSSGNVATGTSGTGTHATAASSLTAGSGTGTGTHGTAASSTGTSSHGPSSSTGTHGTLGTTGTSTNGTNGTTGGPGAECAVCQRDSDCNSNKCLNLGAGNRYCLGACLPGGGCADPDSTCYSLPGQSQSYCIPNSFSCEPNPGTTGTTATFGSIGTTGQSTGTTGLCAPLNQFVGIGNGAVCCSGFADPSGYCSRPGMNTSTGTTGTHGTSGTTGTTGAGGECATCRQNSECASNQCFDVGTGGRCLGVCLASGGCADPNSSCIDVFGSGQGYCIPNSFSCDGNTTSASSSTGTTATFGTTGHNTSTNGTTGTCAPMGTFVGPGNGSVCCTGFADPSGFCSLPGMTTGSSGTNGVTATSTSGTTGSCCATVRCSGGASCDPSTCQCTSSSSGSTGSTLGAICSPCTASSQCNSGYCDPNQGKCSSPNFCASAADCDGRFNCNNTGDCDCSGSGTSSGSSSSTGSVGTSSTGTSGSTGTCSSVEGTTDRDCGATHASCGVGSSCQAFGGAGTGVPFYRTCACHYVGDASGASTDSCGVSSSGFTVCDPETYTCRQPRDFETPNGNTCAPGYGAKAFPGSGTYCVQGCNVSSDCSAPFTACTAGALTVTSPNGTSTTYPGYCNYNTCGPDTPGQPGTTYYGACNAHGVGDGVCQPMDNGGQAYVGVCYATGAALVGAACSSYHSGSQACAGTALCIPLGVAPAACVASAQATECLPTCNANNPGTCPVINGRQTFCNSIGNTPPGATFTAGICY